MALQYILPPEGNFSESQDNLKIRLEESGKQEERRGEGVTVIVAAGLNGEIGRKGGMIWHLPEDLRHFKELTMGGTLIMGRKTWESLPKRPLPGRRNIIVTRGNSYEAPGAEITHSLREALEIASGEGKGIFIIGGGEVYRQSMDFADRIELTRIEASAEDADTFFPLPDEKEWILAGISEEFRSAKGIPFRYETWKRRR